jgi:hypothetical protein
MRAISWVLALLGAALLSPQDGLCEDPNADIKSTPEFRRLCTGFHEDIELKDRTVEQIVEDAIPILGGQNAKSIAAPLRVFLDDVLSGRYSAQQINKLWNTCPADIYVTGPEGGIQLLKAVRHRLDLPPFAGK